MSTKMLVVFLLSAMLLVSVPATPAAAGSAENLKTLTQETVNYFAGRGETTLDRISRVTDETRTKYNAEPSSLKRLGIGLSWAYNVVKSTPEMVYGTVLRVTFPCYGKYKPPVCR